MLRKRWLHVAGGVVGFKDSLLTVPQREDGGRTAYDRFDYQTAWGVSKILELHSSDQNYAVAFEFHDDIVVLDDVDDPKNATFYQIKTQEKSHWTIAKVTSRITSKQGVKLSSHAGKMFDNVVRFGAVVERLVFVSNQPLPEVIAIHGEGRFSDADKAKLQRFVESLVAENDEFRDPEHTSLFFFAFSDLNLASYDQTVLGRIADFLDQEIGDHVPPKPFAQMLNDNCRRRSKKLAAVASFGELRQSKFITRENMLTWLARAKEHHENRPEWSAVSMELDMPYPEKFQVERAWKAYQVAVQSRPSVSTIQMTDRLRDLIDVAMPDASSLVAIVDAVFPQAKPIVRSWQADASDHFVKAAILYEHKR